jgi:hypothetical protein
MATNIETFPKTYEMFENVRMVYSWLKINFVKTSLKNVFG